MWSPIPRRVGLLVALLASSCINSRAERGLAPVWQEVDASQFVAGTTVRGDVLEELGVPSQVISLSRGSVLYYLQERTSTRGVILIVYNNRSERIVYDRAIFFFDESERLTDFAISEAK